MSKYTRIVLGCSVAGLVALSACGGGNDKVSTSNSSPSSDAKQAATTLSSADSMEDHSTDTTDPNFSGKGSGDLCSYAKDIEKSANDLFSDSSDIGADLKKAAKIYEEAISKAPSEIKGDMEKSLTGFQSLTKLLDKYDGDYKKLVSAAASDPEVAKAVAAFDDPEIAAASERVDVYFQKVCGIDTSDTSPDTTG
jgi:hypothetical protein